LRIAAILLQPVMPAAMSKLLDLLAVPSNERDFHAVEISVDGIDPNDPFWRVKAPHRLKAGTKLPPPSPVFPRYVEPEAAAK
jgi:methionyl-tRNA synthetase